MLSTKRLKWIAAVAMIIGIFALQSFAPQNPPNPEPPVKWKNLKVLPKNISHDDLIQTMRGYSISLGVRCGECHQAVQDSSGKTHLDFASDAKPEKNIARQMIKMETAINNKYLQKMSKGDFEKITCATCHRGNIKPLVSVDSLPKPPNKQ